MIFHQPNSALSELRDALEDAIRRAYTGASDGRVPATTNLTLSPGRMRHLEKIQRAAWQVVFERVEEAHTVPGVRSCIDCGAELSADGTCGMCAEDGE